MQIFPSSTLTSLQQHSSMYFAFYLIILAPPKPISPLKYLEKYSLILFFTLNLAEAVNSQLVLQIETSLKHKDKN